MHWAHTYIGRAWTPEQNCWFLVREVLRMHAQVFLPAIPQWQSLRRASRAYQVRRVLAGMPQEFDIVIMRTPFHLHAGIVVVANGRIGILHSTAQTGVVWEPWLQAVEDTTVELWRKF
jgi:hypothetical protein